MPFLCLKSLHCPHIFLRGKATAPNNNLQDLKQSEPKTSESWVLLSLLLYFSSSGLVLLVGQLPSISRPWHLLLPLPEEFFLSVSFPCLLYSFPSNLLLWKFYLKFHPPTFPFPFLSWFSSITNLPPCSKLYTFNLLLLLFSFSTHSKVNSMQAEIFVCFLYCSFHSI